MRTVREVLSATSTGWKPTFHTITEGVQEVIDRSGIRSGICVVYSHHTTCSVMTQESSFDMAYSGLEYLQQDLTDMFEAILPTCRKEGQYMHPGPKLTEFAKEHGEEKPQTLNTEAHLRSVLLGRSETVVIVDGKLDLGQYGNIYFVDFDQTCSRTREIQVQVLGE